MQPISKSSKILEPITSAYMRRALYSQPMKESALLFRVKPGKYIFLSIDRTVANRTIVYMNYAFAVLQKRFW